MNQVSEVAQWIAATAKGRSTTLVAVDGQGGAGKTTLASVLACVLEAIGRRVEVVHMAITSSLPQKGLVVYGIYCGLTRTNFVTSGESLSPDL
jgi:putative protein kinase ArgK-like GTPase of G3E family